MKSKGIILGIAVLFTIALAQCRAAAEDTTIPISTIAELQKIGYDPAFPKDGHYVITQDIDASETATWNDGRGRIGFKPICLFEDDIFYFALNRDRIGSASGGFTGTLDGQGHSITRLFVNNSKGGAGIFQFVGSKGVIRNLILEGGTITGICRNDYVTSLAQLNAGLIENCHSTVTIEKVETAIIVGDYDYLGGLAGLVTLNTGVIRNCSFNGLIRPYATLDARPNLIFRAGGLVAENYGSVIGCHATADVNCQVVSGGLVGESYNHSIIQDSYATGDTPGGGGLIGWSTGTTIARCHATGNGAVGGLVINSSSDTITECYATGWVETGGLIGSATGSQISRCLATGSVAGESMYCGGLIGTTNGVSLQKCLATGDVRGANSFVGGLIGVAASTLVEESLSTGSIHATGSDVGPLVGGTCSPGGPPEVVNSYWCPELSGQDASQYGTRLNMNEVRKQGSYTGFDFDNTWTMEDDETIPHLQCFPHPSQCTIRFLDNQRGSVSPATLITAPWSLTSYTNTPNPGHELAGWTNLSSSSLHIIPPFGPVFVASTDMTLVAHFLPSPITISSVEEFQQIGVSDQYPLFWSYRLGNDIDFSGVASFAPIGAAETPFTGTFDGHGHRITGLMYSSDNRDNLALFSHLGRNGVIENIQMDEVSISGDLYVGCLVADNSGKISGCRVSGNASGRQNVGGLVGRNAPTGIITDSSADVTLRAQSTIGGVVAINERGTLTRCHAIISIYGEDFGHAGGIVGTNSGVVAQCESGGQIIAPFGLVGNRMQDGACVVGGLIAENLGGAVNDCHSSVRIEGRSILGGLIGLNSGIVDLDAHGTISRCYSSGTIKGVEKTGGFIGETDTISMITQCGTTGHVECIGNYVGGFCGTANPGSSISQSFATGDVAGSRFVGGFAGNNVGVIQESVAKGNVSGTKCVGGFVGDTRFPESGGMLSALVETCIATGYVTGTEEVGGFIGNNAAPSLVKESYSVGKVTATSLVGGFLGSSDVIDSAHNSFWDTDTSGMLTSAGGLGRSTDEMLHAATYDGWDFAETWDISDGVSYPFLRALPPDSLVIEGEHPDPDSFADLTPEGDLPPDETWPPEEGQTIEGAQPEGEIQIEGALLEGEIAEGSATEGEPLEGEIAPEGQPNEGIAPEGDILGEGIAPEGEIQIEGAPLEGEIAEGSATEGEPLEGEIAPEGQSLSEGQVAEGDVLPEGETVSKDSDSEGDTPGANQIEGEATDDVVPVTSRQISVGCSAV